MKITSLLTAALLLSQPLHAEVGYQTHPLTVPHRSQSIDLHIWYPAINAGPVTPLGKNAVFTGINVVKDAKPTTTPHPLILLSHGSGGNAVNIGWIAHYLANQGMVVVAPNHPGTTSRDSTPQQTVKIWQRPDDMSAILDFAGQELVQKLHIDMDRIGIVGFSLGGHTALGLAGARADHRRYIDYCTQYITLLDCAWYRAAHLDLTAIDTQQFEQDNRDPRLRVAVAVDPALAQAYRISSFAGINVPVQIINLGAPDTVPMGINARKLPQHLPDVDYRSVAQATHFSFLGLCTEIGEMIISSEGDEPICSEVGERPRSDIHQELQQLIGGFLAKNL